MFFYLVIDIKKFRYKNDNFFLNYSEIRGIYYFLYYFGYE